jgi:hypothetical protein
MPQSPAISAMHSACLSGDAKAMHNTMDALTDEDYAAMARHMKGHDEGMHSMMNGQGMMGDSPDMMDGRGDMMGGTMDE